MASQNNSNGGGGWGILFGVLIVIAIAIYVLAAIGHALGLTPSPSEISDKPDGWVGRHYEGVVMGFVLTVGFVIVAIAVVVLGIQALGSDAALAASAKRWLNRVAAVGFGMAIIAVAAPIGQVGDAAGNVPDVMGMSAAKAEEMIEDESLSPEFDHDPSDDKRCKISWQRPRGGSEADEYDDINLRCVAPIPVVIGRKPYDAERRVDDAGFETHLVNEPVAFSASRCRVTDQSRMGKAQPDAMVKLRLACKKPKPKPEPEPAYKTAMASNCDPNYSPCVPAYPPDIDCADAGPVTVTGSDVHGLDADGDGVACGGD